MNQSQPSTSSFFYSLSIILLFFMTPLQFALMTIQDSSCGKIFYSIDIMCFIFGSLAFTAFFLIIQSIIIFILFRKAEKNRNPASLKEKILATINVLLMVFIIPLNAFILFVSLQWSGTW